MALTDTVFINSMINVSLHIDRVFFWLQSRGCDFGLIPYAFRHTCVRIKTSFWLLLIIMRILIAEDDNLLADALTQSLRQSGYAVDAVSDGQAADTVLRSQEFDLLILDLGLPRLSGLEVLQKLRAQNSRLPVLILTAADSVEQRVKGLDLGADDYMAKPFALSELEARVRALTRRGAGGGSALVKHGRLVFDQTGRVALVDDKTLDLSAREISLLEILLTRAGRMVNKSQIVDHLCQWGEEVSSNAIEVYVHRLRKKLEPSGVRIATVRGLGYCLQRDPNELTEGADLNGGTK
jgi:two-component system, OmpR family, response regulator